MLRLQAQRLREDKMMLSLMRNYIAMGLGILVIGTALGCGNKPELASKQVAESVRLATPAAAAYTITVANDQSVGGCVATQSDPPTPATPNNTWPLMGYPSSAGSPPTVKFTTPDDVTYTLDFVSSTPLDGTPSVAIPNKGSAGPYPMSTNLDGCPGSGCYFQYTIKANGKSCTPPKLGRSTDGVIIRPSGY